MSDLSIFLIDDDADEHELFDFALNASRLQYTYSSAKSGEEALEKLKNDTSLLPDYIFLDLNMPGMGGMECLAEIKKIPRLAGIPVIIYTTSSNPAYMEEAKKGGASHYLVKPLTISHLTAILADILSGKNLPFLLNVR